MIVADSHDSISFLVCRGKSEPACTTKPTLVGSAGDSQKSLAPTVAYVPAPPITLAKGRRPSS